MKTSPHGTTAPLQFINGIGRLGQVTNCLNPLVVDPACNLQGGELLAAVLGRQGRVVPPENPFPMTAFDPDVFDAK